MRTPSTPNLTVLVPVYRSEKTIQLLYERTRGALDQAGVTFELLLVEDAGGDHAWDIVQQIARRDPRVRGLRLGRNFGQHNALLCGIREAQGDLIVTLDDDLQHPPEEIPKLLERIKSGADVVYGKPARDRHSFWRNVTSVVTKSILKRVMGISNASDVGAFRAFHTHLREAFVHFDHPYVNIDVLLSWGTSRFDSVFVGHDSRIEGKSTYTFRKLARHAGNLLTGFSSGPLRVASWLGFAAMFLGLSVLIYVLIVFFAVGRVVPGFAFLASLIAIFSGTQLFTIGIIGEYLARIHTSSLKRPAYLVQERTGGRA